MQSGKLLLAQIEKITQSYILCHRMFNFKLNSVIFCCVEYREISWGQVWKRILYFYVYLYYHSYSILVSVVINKYNFIRRYYVYVHDIDGY